MAAKQLRSMSEEQLGDELLKLRREQFNLRMQQASGRLSRPHEHGRVRKEIARVKTVLNELKHQRESASE
ncbi:MAG TPA: 50S ribosomal protein L29 [Woeseiaceae bacterium]|nr:50S ribosomal protein L29 [Woeseiaceae bacterium]